MNKIISWALGVTLGAGVGAVLVALFAPFSGKELTERLKTGYAEAVEEARYAAKVREAELQAELLAMQKRRK